MSEMKSRAMKFYDACEAGEGWEGCKAYCHPEATFSCQAGALADVTTLEDYTEWAKAILTPLPDLRPEVKSFAVDEERGNVTVYAVVHGTQTGEGGPVPPTGKKLAADYVYSMEFEDGRIRHMTKIWNDGHSFQQVGWA